MRLSGRELTEAAVLVPIFYKDGEYNILFTQRSDQVPHHKGQISFPGGARSEVDASLLDTALRESCEEIGLKASDADVVGELDDTPTTTSSFNISPFVAFVPHPYNFALNPYEIDLCELHDAFKPVPWIAAEDLALAERGEGHRFVLEEKNRIGKSVYVNRSGGFLARTHPLGASGGAQLVELVWQLRGRHQYRQMFGEELKNLNYGLWFNMSGFGNTCVVGIVERTKSTREREGLREENLPQSIPEEMFIQEKLPRKDKIIAATQYTSPEEERVNVAIIQTKEGDFRIGLAKEPVGLKRGKYIKWIKPEEDAYFVREGYLKGKLSDFLKLFRRKKKEKK